AAAGIEHGAPGQSVGGPSRFFNERVSTAAIVVGRIELRAREASPLKAERPGVLLRIDESWNAIDNGIGRSATPALEARSAPLKAVAPTLEALQLHGFIRVCRKTDHAGWTHASEWERIQASRNSRFQSFGVE